MSVLVTINGIDYTIPEPGELYWGDNVTSAWQAIASSTLQLSTTSFPLSNPLDFTGIDVDDGLIVGNISESGTVASAGLIRLSNTGTIAWRNAGDTADIVLGVSGGVITVDGTPLVTTFTALSDTPASYSGQATKVLRVNAGGTAVEFVDATTVGVTDHGALTGLADDDHTQYHNDTRGDARYYTKTLLDAGQLDTRYYTETEVDALTWDASDIVSGTFADARIGVTNVTQHVASIDHDSLLNYNIAQHRVINDGGTAVTDLWSGSYISSQIAALGSADTVKLDVNQVAHGFVQGDMIYWNGSAWVKAVASAASTIGGHMVDYVDVDNFFAVQVGIVTGLSGLTAGDWYYLDQSTAGAITNVAPTSGLVKPIGIALSTTSLDVTEYPGYQYSAGGGGGGSGNLTDLLDVVITTPADDEVLAYDNGSGNWINQTPAEAGLSAVGHTHTASDVTDFSTAADARIAAANIDDLNDVVITTPADNEVLAYDNGSGNFINQTPSEAGLAVPADITYETLDTNGDVGTSAGQLAIGNHNHSGVYQPLDSDLTTLAGLAKTKGNLIAGNGSAWAALGVGTDGYVLTADSGAANGVSWQAESAGGGPAFSVFNTSNLAVSSTTFATVSGFTTTNLATGYYEVEMNLIYLADPTNDLKFQFTTTGVSFINGSALLNDGSGGTAITLVYGIPTSGTIVANTISASSPQTSGIIRFGMNVSSGTNSINFQAALNAGVGTGYIQPGSYMKITKF